MGLSSRIEIGLCILLRQVRQRKIGHVLHKGTRGSLTCVLAKVLEIRRHLIDRPCRRPKGEFVL